jgi:hypothetical protein
MIPREADVEWTCVVFRNVPFLAVQTRSEMISGYLMSRAYERLDARFVLDDSNTAREFAVFADRDFQGAILRVAPDEDLLNPLLSALAVDLPWFFVLQVTVEKERHRQMWQVLPDGQAVPIETPEGAALLPGWIIELE